VQPCQVCLHFLKKESRAAQTKVALALRLLASQKTDAIKNIAVPGTRIIRNIAKKIGQGARGCIGDCMRKQCNNKLSVWLERMQLVANMILTCREIYTTTTCMAKGKS